VIDVLIEDPAWEAAEPRAAALAEIAAAAVLEHERAAAGDLAILLADDARLSALNATFRGKYSPTNVLSFPAAGDASASETPNLGDIALAFGVCAREAAEQGKSLAHHLQHLTAHGVLHLLGYDHESDAEAEAMEAAERAILAGIGVADPYAPEHGGEGRG
jgi:probable rRNA maturation factor